MGTPGPPAEARRLRLRLRRLRLRLRLRRLRLRRLVRRGGCGRALGGLSLGRKVRHVEVLARGRLRQRR